MNFNEIANRLDTALLAMHLEAEDGCPMPAGYDELEELLRDIRANAQKEN